MRQQHQDGDTISNYGSLICITMIDPYTGWFGIVKDLRFDIDKVMGSDNE